ncbi:Nose resistant to fluoxetine protein [Apis cerana cerana]|uniref:Nose resistant to fluoxetine protein n=1 Tax=Apis cerana cerana TaxID=94128 RepID=A0A2A3EH83_APICC|nr:Nose resistant to fluoxetine protein [Apis cerana cerana]
MNSKALALLIILRVIRANPSDYSNIGEKIGCADHEASFTLARIDRSIDCAISLGSLSNETQFAAPRKETIKNLENGSCYERRTLPLRSELGDGISHLLRFTPNFTFVQNVECREQVNVFLRELRNYKFWAMEMLDSNGKLPSSFLQGNVNQYGDFDRCLNVMAHERSNGREIEIRGRYFLALIDVDATHPIMENLVSIMKSRNMFSSSLHEKRGHFFPKFPLIRWALCLPSACSNEDAKSLIQRTLDEYNSTVGIEFMVHVDPNTSYVKQESSSYAKETIYVLVEKFYSMSNLMYIVPFYRITPYVCGVALSVLLHRVGKEVKVPKVRVSGWCEKIRNRELKYFFQLVVSAGWSISTMIVIWTMVSQYEIVKEDYVFDVVSLSNFVVISQLLWTLAQCWIIFACYTNNGVEEIWAFNIRNTTSTNAIIYQRNTTF